MKLNTIKPAQGAKTPAKRVGRGIGSGLGKTCGRGHKGQKARAGGFHKVGFEGGQMPLQRRLPKFGFTSKKSLITEEVRLSSLMQLAEGEVVTVDSLKAAGLIKSSTQFVKVIASGELARAISIKQIKVTKGARAIIEAQGGSVEE